MLFFRMWVVHLKGQVTLTGWCIAFTGYAACSGWYYIISKLISSFSIDVAL